MLTLEGLVAEGESLARPCVLLRAASSSRVGGYWGGEREDKPNFVPAIAARIASVRHIVTIDDALLRDVDMAITAPLSLFEFSDVRGNHSHRVERVPSTAFSAIRCTGEPLHAERAVSFPPFEAICLYGTEKVEAWLRELGLARHEYVAAATQPVAEQYRQEYLRRAPFFVGGADAIVGGWHLMWPEDDFFMPLEMRLVVTTIRDAESFFEIWASPSLALWVMSRIT